MFSMNNYIIFLRSLSPIGYI